MIFNGRLVVWPVGEMNFDKNIRVIQPNIQLIWVVFRDDFLMKNYPSAN